MAVSLFSRTVRIITLIPWCFSYLTMFFQVLFREIIFILKILTDLGRLLGDRNEFNTSRYKRRTYLETINPASFWLHFVPSHLLKAGGKTGSIQSHEDLEFSFAFSHPQIQQLKFNWTTGELSVLVCRNTEKEKNTPVHSYSNLVLSSALTDGKAYLHFEFASF